MDINGKYYNSKKDYLSTIKEDVINKYKELKNVWKVAEYFNVGGGTVHDFLSEHGEINKMRIFTEEEYEFLRKNYKKYRDNGNLKELAEKLNRNVQFICRKAKKIGLTDSENRIKMKYMAKEMSIIMKKIISEKGHPRGMLGKTHTDENKRKTSERTKELWKDPNSYFNSEKNKQRLSDSMSLNQAKGFFKNNYSRVKNGTVDVNGRKIFFRSSWEANIAFYLDLLKSQKEIIEWEYEPDVFWFDKIKRGVRSYKPDFKITKNDLTHYYIEVKGWMDEKSKTKLNRMRIYYPNVEIKLIDSSEYNKIKRQYSQINGWGALENGEVVNFEKCKIENCKNKSFKNDLCRKHYYKKI